MAGHDDHDPVGVRRAVVIGSSCFTGSHVVDALLRQTKADVHGISRSAQPKALYLPYLQQSPERDLERFRFHQIDMVTEPDVLIRQLDELAPEIVINVAALSEVALSNDRPVEYFETNTLAVVRLVDQLRRRRYLHRYVHISSAEIFGSCTDPVSVTRRFNPSTPYAVSKASADMYLEVAARNLSLPVTIIRSTNVYGAHQQLFKIIPRTAIYILSGRMLELHGGGTSRKNFIHVRDVVDGLMLALSKDLGGTFHLTVDSPRTVADVVRMVCDQMDAEYDEVVRVVGERLGQDAWYRLDVSRSEAELGWSPRVSFEQGVAETVEWVRRGWHEIRDEPLEYIHRAPGSPR